MIDMMYIHILRQISWQNPYKNDNSPVSYGGPLTRQVIHLDGYTLRRVPLYIKHTTPQSKLLLRAGTYLKIPILTQASMGVTCFIHEIHSLEYILYSSAITSAIEPLNHIHS